jgi:uncharacterized protein (TIGR03435 family)
MERSTILFLALPAILGAQEASRLRFEVTSVKPMAEGVYANGMRSTGMVPPIEGDPVQITFNDVSLVGILCRAYSVMPPDIHAPEWMKDQRYKVLAKVPPDAPKGHIPEMLQNLLTDRFAMKLHWETKEESGYSLTVANGGPKLKTAAPNASRSASMRPDGHLEYKSYTMGELANALRIHMGRAVVNRTDLSGAYDISVDAAPDSMPGFRFGNGQGSAFPTIFQALHELGLNLTPGKVPVKYLVVDSALKVPTEN